MVYTLIGYTKKMSRIWVLVVCLIVIAVGGVMAIACNKLSNNTVIATIGLENVYYGEYLLYSPQIKTEVIHEITNGYQISYDDHFWSFDIDGKTPLDLVKERTLENLVSIKAEQSLMRQYGISDGFSYKEFEKQLREENKIRLNNEKNGKANYGRVEYSEEMYYSLMHDKHVALLKEKIASEMDLSNKTLKNTYDELKNSDSKFKMPGEFTIQKISVENNEVVNTIVYNTEKIENMGNIPSYEYTRCMNLKEGEQTEKFQDTDGIYYIYVCTERKKETYRSFDEMKSSVKSFMIEDTYNEILKHVNKSIKLTKQYYKINLGD